MKPSYWSEACRALSQADPTLKDIIASAGDEMLERKYSPFQTLARCIVGQQISTKAADSIWKRFEALTQVSPQGILDHEHFRDIGMSYRKSEYLRCLAAYFLEEPSLNPEDLIRIKGIGEWSITMFRIFYLLEADVFPAQDVGIQNAVARAYFEGVPLSRDALTDFSERWRPFRTVATWYLWRHIDATAVAY